MQKNGSVSIMQYKEDLRIQKTRKVLRESILALLKDRPLEKITVKDICEHAMINRMTFYKHYEDKYLLLDDAINEIKDSIMNQIPKKQTTSIDDIAEYLISILGKVIEYIETNIEYIRSLEKNSSFELINIIARVCEDGISELLVEIDKIRPFKYSIPVTASFIYGGFVSALTYLIHHKNQSYKAEIKLLMADLKTNLFKIDFLYKE